MRDSSEAIFGKSMVKCAFGVEAKGTSDVSGPF